MDKDIPRFVVTLADTKTDTQLSAAADSLMAFRKPLPFDKRPRGVKNELDLMFKVFQEDIKKQEAKLDG